MPRRPDLDVAVEHLSRYTSREPWPSLRREHLATMLGNRSPRQCARSRQGWARLLGWLKEVENGELQQAARSGSAPYDMAWMWRELGVEAER